MKYIPLILASCVAVSANAATYNAQGKIINSKEAKNPGIVKFEKNKAVAAKNTPNKQNSLAKTATPATTDVIQVIPYEGRFSTSNNSYTLKVNGYNQNVSTQQQYTDLVDYLESQDAARNNANYHSSIYQNSHTYETNYKYSNGSDCRITSTSYNYNAFFNDVYADILNGLHFNPTYSGSTPTHGCSGSGTYSNTCGRDINIYNVVADYNPITFNGNSCKITDPTEANRALNYAYRIQHYYANQILLTTSPNANLYTVAERHARGNGRYMTSDFLWNFFNNPESKLKAPHIGNIIASSRKDVSSYTTEAAAIDEYIYYTRSIQFAAYTEEGKKTGPGTSLNAITVSPANSDGYVLKRDVVTGVKLNEKVGQSTIHKPEIYSLSYAYNSYNDFSRKVKHDNNEYDILGITDSWGASTTAAAMAADLLSKYPFYKWHPELVKALMRTAHNRGKLKKLNYTNINDITQSNILTGSQNLTTPLTSFEEMLRNNVSRYWYGNNSDFFNNDILTFTEDVDRGGKYNVAIAWLINGRYAWENRNLSSRYNLRIYDDATGKKITENTSTLTLTTFRSNEINIPSDVSRIRVEIERNRNTGDRVILGFNMHKVTQ